MGLKIKFKHDNKIKDCYMKILGATAHRVDHAGIGSGRSMAVSPDKQKPDYKFQHVIEYGIYDEKNKLLVNGVHHCPYNLYSKKNIFEDAYKNIKEKISLFKDAKDV